MTSDGFLEMISNIAENYEYEIARQRLTDIKPIQELIEGKVSSVTIPLFDGGELKVTKKEQS